MQAHGAAQGVGAPTTARPGGRRLAALLAAVAILVVLAVMAVMARGVDAPAGGGVAARDAEAGAAVVHDDAGNVKPR